MSRSRQLTCLWEWFLFVLLATMLVVQIADGDIWYHLSIGREVFRSLEIPAREFLVYPNMDKPGSFHEWGFGLMHYLAYQAGGYWGMSILNALMAALVLFFVYRAAQPATSDQPWHFIALLALLVWMQSRLIYRPEMVLYLALAIEICLLERYLSRPGWKWLAPIPLVGFLLSQAHPSVIFMIAVLGGYLAQILWESRRALVAAAPDVARFGLTAAITFVLAAVNPYGFEQIFLPFDFAAAGRVVLLIEEFQNVLQAGYERSYFALLCASGLALILARKRRPVDWIFFCVFGYLAFAYVRNIALFALVMYVPMARGLSDVVDRLLIWFRGPLSGKTGARVLRYGWVAAFVALSIVFFTPIVIRPWGAGPYPLMFPETAARAIKDIRPPGQLFNFYDFGGYLGWVLEGEYKVFIDGRHYKANRALSVHRAVTTGRAGWQKALEHYDISMIVMQGTYRLSGELIPIVGILAKDPHWMLAARGERALLFIKRDIASGLPSRYRLDKRQVWEQVIAEANFVLQHVPNSPKAYLSLGEAYLELGHRELAIEQFDRYVEMVPGDFRTANRLRELKALR